MATDLGKVGMRMRGDWNSSTAYEVLDAVSYNGGIYIAKQNVPANTVPTNTTYWQVGLDPSTMNSYFKPIKKVQITSSIPTVEELESITWEKGVYTVFFYTTDSTVPRSGLDICLSSATYGAGIMYSYYSNSYYKVKNANGTWTITAF